MRRLILIASLASSASAFADHEITVPKGRKLLDGQFRAEILGVPGERTTRAWLGAGFLKAFDLELTSSRGQDTDWRSSFDFSYNYSPPIMDVAPGVSIGVQDALNVTEEGRAAFLAVTYRYGNEGALNQDIPTDLTLGIWSRKTGLAFFGVNLPFSETFRLIGEHNSKRLAGGFELRARPGIVFKTVFEAGGTQFGLSLNTKF
ncbi:MAG: hypothetical protein JSS66_13600 [Armatimonadetes bacterium]|nr:hypothetical protein [Armatimonadota bacterium]